MKNFMDVELDSGVEEALQDMEQVVNTVQSKVILRKLLYQIKNTDTGLVELQKRFKTLGVTDKARRRLKAMQQKCNLKLGVE